MLFNSWVFVAFFLVVYAAYLCLGRRGQNGLLLAASYFFYACWDWRFLSLILISTANDYGIALALARSERPGVRKALLLASVASSLGLLGFFKYYDFFVSSLAELFAVLGLSGAPQTLGIIVPVGISFYTFQTMSYTIDVYRRELPACRSPLDFALYVSFFPQLVAGPIERGTNLLPQVQGRRTLTLEGVRNGVWWLVLGYFLKVYVADNLAPHVNAAYAAQEPTGNAAFLAFYGFAFQIYCDFAGYTHIARGTASLMGFRLMENFRMPYLAVNPSDFWRRWHISLSSWLRDYLYIPLGGNRGGPGRTQLNLVLTMLLGGLWHGAQWKFVLWGAFHGVLLMVFRPWTRPGTGGRDGAPLRPAHPLLRRLRHVLIVIVFFHIVSCGWLLFRCEHLRQAWQFPVLMLSDLHWTPEFRDTLLMFGLLILPVVLIDVLAEKSRAQVEFVVHWPFALRWLVYLVLLATIALLGSRGQEKFIYFQF